MISVFRTMALSLAASGLAAAAAQADPVSVGYYGVTATRNFDDLNQHAVSLGLELPWRWRSVGGWQLDPELVVDGGVLEQREIRRGFVSLGLALQLHRAGGRWYAGFGVAPTYVGDPEFADGELLGGPFQFTTHFAVGREFGARHIHAIAIRLQHTSNGGFSEPNPGVEMIGIAYHRLIGRHTGAAAWSRASHDAGDRHSSGGGSS